MRKTATFIATLMMGVASCAYAQGGPPSGGGGGAGDGAGGSLGFGGGAPGGGGPAAAPDAGGSTSVPGAGEPSEPLAGGDGPSAERATPRGEASEGASSGEHGAGPKSAEDADAGPASKGEGPKGSRRERQADDGDDAKGPRDKQPKADADDDKSRKRGADKSESKDLGREAADTAKQKTDDVTGKDPGQAPKDADAASAGKSERAKQVDLSGGKRDRVQAALRDKGDVKRRTDIDIDISIGHRLPRDWHFAPVPIAVMEIVPEYRDYVFVWVEDEYVICDPVTYEVIAIIPASDRDYARAGSPGPGGKCSPRLTLSEEQEELILRSVRLGHEVDVAHLEIGWSVPSDIELERFPAAVLSEADELSACRYFIADDQLAIVDPDADKVVLLIDKS